MERGAHRARTPGQPYAGPPVLPDQKVRNVDAFLANMNFLLVGAANRAAGTGRGAHRAGTPARQHGLYCRRRCGPSG
eukprot:8525882-Pyramimonas_sp.AAC.1